MRLGPGRSIPNADHALCRMRVGLYAGGVIQEHHGRRELDREGPLDERVYALAVDPLTPTNRLRSVRSAGPLQEQPIAGRNRFRQFRHVSLF